MMIYIISQIFVIISYTFLSFTYFSKDKKKILIMSCASVLFNAIAFMLLGAMSGLAMSVVGIIRNIIFLIRGKNEKINYVDGLILSFFFAIMIASIIFTYSGVFSMFSILGTIIYTYSAWQKSPRIYKILGIPSSICWIIYNIYVASIFGTILESILLVFEIVGVTQSCKKIQ